MSRPAAYRAHVQWTDERWGQVALGNGPTVKFAAPPDAQGCTGVLTPEDAAVAAANTCVMLRFIWAAERFQLNLLSYECRAEGRKLIELDRMETFTRFYFHPVMQMACGPGQKEIGQDLARIAGGAEIQPGDKLGEVRNCNRAGNHHERKCDIPHSGLNYRLALASRCEWLVQKASGRLGSDDGVRCSGLVSRKRASESAGADDWRQRFRN